MLSNPSSLPPTLDFLRLKAPVIPAKAGTQAGASSHYLAPGFRRGDEVFTSSEHELMLSSRSNCASCRYAAGFGSRASTSWRTSAWRTSALLRASSVIQR